MNNKKHPSSFRDPSGFIFYKDGKIYRQVNDIYKENYDHLIASGLYEDLVKAGLLIPHKEIDTKYTKSKKCYKVIKPEQITFISYPYEWCFSQLKDAALTTLEVQKKAIDFDMSLKDCSAYNIQFRKGKPILIDTLSFEKYRSGLPWVAYRQFCQHFLAPLAIMSYKDVRLNQLFKIYSDGIPLDLASSFLPFYTHFNFSLLTHIHLHAASQKKFADKVVIDKNERTISRLSFMGIIDGLETAIKKLKLKEQNTEWANYYCKKINYSSDALKHKKQIVAEFLDSIKPKIVWDLGANDGTFSRIVSDKASQIISYDKDHTAVEKNYLNSVKKRETNILPLILDLVNPSPGIGWENQERMSLIERGPTDALLALALIHHLSISNNLPFENIATFFNKICGGFLIVEFIPKSDSQVQKLLSTREDIFADYKKDYFEYEFEKYFKIQRNEEIKDSKRTLYLMQKR